jgi:hypothetical protein
MDEQTKNDQKMPDESILLDSEPSESDESADDGFMGAEHFEGLGNVWSALLGDDGSISDVLPTIIAEGKPIPICKSSENKSQMDVLLLQYPSESSVCAGVLLVKTHDDKNWGVCSAYPILEGKSVNLTINKTHIWGNGVEGVVAAHSAGNGPPISFFAPFYLRDFASVALESDKVVRIGALAFSLRQAEPNEFSVRQGALYEDHLRDFLEENPEKTQADFTPPIVSFRGAKILLPSDYSTEWKFRCPVFAVEEVSFMDIKVYKLAVDFVGVDDDVMSGYLYASEKILDGYVPEVGHDVEGGLWMTGMIADS